ncbi:hypothetical protein MBRA1_001854 [Malassezia brasiliensis]|uniref:Uncharacterized protein n=1 Tax=Malassezia brasiliensis TaxID=1821822 RepID=A0AAF0INN3_9BASI|nr:hypothetical protein MBRA1_001854 [Malassezia brasiliensis]
MARWMASALPDRRVNLFGWRFRLNPGPFSAKEHVLIAVTVTSGATSAYASDIINIQELFFHQHMSAIPALTLLITTQVIGFGFAGLVRVSQILSSGYRGFGILNFSFDWNVVGSSGPLFQPWWAALNFYAGIMGMMYVVMPLLYFFNFWEAQSFPAVLSSGLFTRNYTNFDVDGVLKKDNSLDEAAWERNKPLLLTPFFALSYGISITHVLLWHGKEIKKALFNPVYSDVHNKLMQSYPLVPQSWYLWTLALSLGSASILVMTSPLQFPVWGLLLSVGMSLFFLIPIGILKAVSDTGVGLNVITEFVAGFLIPGKPIGNVCWKCYGYMSCAQALDLIGDMKLAHYMSFCLSCFGPERFFSGRYRNLYWGFALALDAGASINALSVFVLSITIFRCLCLVDAMFIPSKSASRMRTISLERRQSASASSGSDDYNPGPSDDPPSSGPIFSYPFITLAVVAVAVFVLITILVAVRMTVWNRRARQRMLDMNEEYFVPHPFAPQRLAVDPIKPPPILEKKIASVGTHHRLPFTHATADWSTLQPVSVCFDQETSNAIRAAHDSQDPNEPMSPKVQVTCLVSLPTARTVFPDRLRRRPLKDVKASIINPLFEGIHGRPSYEGDLTGDLSHGPSIKRPNSVYSRISTKEASDARRDAYFENMEKEAQLGDSGLAPPRPELSRRNSRTSMATDNETKEGDVEHVGIFAFGSVVLPVIKGKGKELFLEKNGRLKRSDVMTLMEHTQRVQSPTKL